VLERERVSVFVKEPVRARFNLRAREAALLNAVEKLRFLDDLPFILIKWLDCVGEREKYWGDKPPIKSVRVR
jgi:hypothetical protein